MPQDAAPAVLRAAAQPPEPSTSSPPELELLDEPLDEDVAPLEDEDDDAPLEEELLEDAGAHTPAAHTPLVHSVLAVHAAPSASVATQILGAGVSLHHLPVPQSAFAAHV